MPRKPLTSTEPISAPELKPSLSLEAQEAKMIKLAMKLVEKRLREGTASSQETTHFLKLGSTREQLEQKNMMANQELMRAKKAALESSKISEEMYSKAIAAMKSYSASSDDDIIEGGEPIYEP